MKRLRPLLPLLLLIAIGLVLLASGALERFDPHHVARQRAELQAFIAAHPLRSGLTQIGIMMLAVATGLPGAIVVVFAGGILFGTVIGSALSALGTTLGALILFGASRAAFAAGSHHEPTLVTHLRTGFHTWPLSYTMFLRLVPFFPFGAVTVALAWLRCPWWLFILATALGGSVMIAFETALGAGLGDTILREGSVSLNLFTHRRVLLPLLGMALLALLPIAIGKLRRAHGASDRRN